MMTDQQAAALVALDDVDRDRLRELVVWVLDYERHDRSPTNFNGGRKSDETEKKHQPNITSRP